MNILSVVGARPQFVKLSPMDKEVRRRDEHVIVHTGQHYDRSMSESFFDVLSIPEPDYNLDVGSMTHGRQTGEMICRLEDVFEKEGPDFVLLYGDTNSTLAGAVAASKLHIPVAHIEAGLRSFNRRMPEEINRVLTDHASDLLFCPSASSYKNLKAEGLEERSHVVGDVMFQLLIEIDQKLSSDVLRERGLFSGDYVLMTMHRQENVDDERSLRAVVEFVSSLDEAVVFPVHPRTKARLSKFGLLDMIQSSDNVILLEPQDFLAFSSLEKNARLILTDSGGVQKDAYFFGVPCITLREETEWVETVEEGWNVLTGVDPERMAAAYRSVERPHGPRNAYGGADVTSKILDKLREWRA